MTLKSASWWCRKILYCWFVFLFLYFSTKDKEKKKRVLKARRLKKQAEVSYLDFDMEEYELNLIVVADKVQS